MRTLYPMNVALVHEQLTQDGGSEAVFKAIAELFPNAPIFTPLYFPDAVDPFFRGREIHQSYLAWSIRFPWIRRRWRHFMPLFPRIMERFDLSSYDVIISSSSGFAKSVRGGPQTFHLCYCHSPARFLWIDSEGYVREYRASRLLKHFAPFVLSHIRRWDKLTASRPNVYVANSKNAQKRIKMYYERESELLYPLVEVEKGRIGSKEDFFLVGGRLVAYKRFDIAVKAFNKLRIPLKVFGVGPELKKLQRLAKKNVTFLGKISDAEKWELFSRSRAFLYPQEEDWGITAVESLASGTPVIAFRGGGALETIDESRGVFFEEQTWESLADAVLRFQQRSFDPYALRAFSLQFSGERFKQQFLTIFERELEKFQRAKL